MRAVLQRVTRASVEVDGEIVGSIAAGWLVLLGVAAGDESGDSERLAEKIVQLRAFSDENGKMNRSVIDIGGSILVVSQFTLLGDCRAGRRPSFTSAADPDLARRLYDEFQNAITRLGVPCSAGVFAADMKVSLVNDGPVTLLLDTRKAF